MLILSQFYYILIKSKDRALAPIGGMRSLTLKTKFIFGAFFSSCVMNTGADIASGIILTVFDNMTILEALVTLSWSRSKFLNCKINITYFDIFR